MIKMIIEKVTFPSYGRPLTSVGEIVSVTKTHAHAVDDVFPLDELKEDDLRAIEDALFKDW